MYFPLTAVILSLAPLALAQVNKAGGPQSPPPTSAIASMSAVPTVATILTLNSTASSVAPATTALVTNPIQNTSSTINGNLSTIATPSTVSGSSSAAAGAGTKSQSVVLITTSLSGGQQTTITSFAVANPTGGAGSGGAPGTTATGTTQNGAEGGRVGAGAWGAMVVAIGIGALFL